ncbi:hypothetical protein Mapa_006530 [Marchantia paleacea]|nr:hypothetical protein Mapa_006530 [Marchantia paleacea]
MEERTLEVNIVSAGELRKVKTFGSPKCYVVAYIYSNQKKSTKVDKAGGLNPTWNSKLLLTCDDRLLHQPGYFITLEVISDGFLRNKQIGTVTIPLQEIAGDEKFNDKPQVMAFQVRSRRTGELRGVLNLSIRLGAKRIIQMHVPQQSAYMQQAAYPPGYGGGYGAQYGAPQYGYGQGQSQYGGGYQQRPRRGGPGFGAGLLGGALGGMLIGDMMGDMGDCGGGDF